MKKSTIVGLTLILDGEHSKEEIEKYLIPKIRWISVRGPHRFYSGISIESLEVKEDPRYDEFLKTTNPLERMGIGGK